MQAQRQSDRTGFTLIELLMTVAIVAILASILLPAISKGKLRARQSQCVSNLKQIGQALHAYAHEHNSRFPWQVPLTEGGTLEIYTAAWAGAQNLWPMIPARHYLAMSNELGSAKITVCPSSRVDLDTLSFDRIRSGSGYWLSEAADYDEPLSVVAGDPNVTNRVISAGPFVRIRPNEPIGWGPDLHEFRGNLLFADGHVEQLTSAGLQRVANASSSAPPPVFAGGGQPPSSNPGGGGSSPPSSAGPGSSGPSSSGGGASSSGGGGAAASSSGGGNGGGLFGNLDEALGGRQAPPPARGPRSSSTSISTRRVTEVVGPETQLTGSRKPATLATNRVALRTAAAAEAPVAEPAPAVDSFRQQLAMPLLEGERINYKAVMLLLLAAYFTFELLRRHRRRRALRRTYSSSPR